MDGRERQPPDPNQGASGTDGGLSPDRSCYFLGNIEKNLARWPQLGFAGHGRSYVATLANFGFQGNLPEQGHGQFVSQRLTATFAE